MNLKTLFAAASVPFNHSGIPPYSVARNRHIVRHSHVPDIYRGDAAARPVIVHSQVVHAQDAVVSGQLVANRLDQFRVRLAAQQALDRLAHARVIVVGLGGVGSYCAEALARAGVGSLILVDGDLVSVTNINRQLLALVDTVGLPKAEVMADRIRRINPDCDVVPMVMWVDRGNVDGLIASGPNSAQYVADAIDTIPAKLDLIEACLRSGVGAVSSMGAGNRLDPTRFRVADISQTHTCPMARAVRQGLRRRGIPSGLTVVFSDEPPVVQRPGPVGSISMVPGAAGLAMASVIIRKLAFALPEG